MRASLTAAEVDNVLRSETAAQVAFYHDGEIHLVPVSYDYDGEYAYVQAPDLASADAIRHSPDVCFKVEHTDQDAVWHCVVAQGVYEEVRCTSGTFPTASDVQEGQLVDGKYRLTRLLGHGAMGAVYEAENLAIRKRVAVKFLHQAFAGDGASVLRFDREAQALGQVESEHILGVLDLGTLANGQRYLVTEYLEGETLADRIKTHERLLPRQVAPIAIQLLEALRAVHGAGIIHRDIKPENVFLVAQKGQTRDFVKLIDFGISKFQNDGNQALRATSPGTLIGSPAYMSPEQMLSADVDHRADIYAVGILLFEAVTGCLPFQGETLTELVCKTALSTAPVPSQYVPDLDRDFEAIIVRAMARDKNERYASAEEFTCALTRWLQRSSSFCATLVGAGDSVRPAPQSRPAPTSVPAPSPCRLRLVNAMGHLEAKDNRPRRPRFGGATAPMMRSAS
jgi:serine/threonine protein kinase